MNNFIFVLIILVIVRTENQITLMIMKGESGACTQNAADYRRAVYGCFARSCSWLPPAELVWVVAEPQEFTN